MYVPPTAFNASPAHPVVYGLLARAHPPYVAMPTDLGRRTSLATFEVAMAPRQMVFLLPESSQDCTTAWRTYEMAKE
jgi:hypothetical protein